MDNFVLFILLSLAFQHFSCADFISTRKDEKSGSSKFLQTENVALEVNGNVSLLLRSYAENVKVDGDTIRKGIGADVTFETKQDVKNCIEKLIKDVRPLNDTTAERRYDLQLLFNNIPESLLFHLNLSNSQLVDLLGKEQLTRRKMGILAMAFSKLHPDEDIINSVSLINHIRGILCGFSLYDLQRMTADTIIRLDPDVCYNLLACTHRQLNVLYKTATLPQARGPSFSWSKEDVYRLGYLFLEATEEEINHISPRSFSGLSRLVVELLTPEQIQAIYSEQVDYMEKDAQEAYRLRVRHISRTSSSHRLLQNIWLCPLLTFWIVGLQSFKE